MESLVHSNKPDEKDAINEIKSWRTIAVWVNTLNQKTLEVGADEMIDTVLADWKNQQDLGLPRPVSVKLSKASGHRRQIMDLAFKAGMLLVAKEKMGKVRIEFFAQDKDANRIVEQFVMPVVTTSFPYDKEFEIYNHKTKSTVSADMNRLMGVYDEPLFQKTSKLQSFKKFLSKKVQESEVA